MYHKSSVSLSVTALWHIKKEKLINGPTFLNAFMDMDVHHLCAATLNRSHVMLIGYDTVVIFDFVEKSWYFISVIELEYDINLYNCRASVAIEKSGKK